MLAVVPEPTADAAEAGDWYRLTADEACRRLGVDPAVGLDDAEVAERRARYGPNKLAEEAKEPAWHAFLRQYREAGDKVPADGRLLVAATLEIEEAGLTGESTPVAKSLEPVSGEDVSLGDRVDMAYMNSQVTRGRGEMVVTATGMASEVGHISGMLSGVEQEKTPLTRSLLHVAAALEWRDPRESIFRRETVANGRFNLLTLAAVALTLLVTTVPLLQRIFDTVDLDGHQWRACLVAVAAYLALTEAAKFVLRRIDPEGA
jgi:magnesium-transporting ATPase (P-type)